MTPASSPGGDITVDGMPYFIDEDGHIAEGTRPSGRQRVSSRTSSHQATPIRIAHAHPHQHESVFPGHWLWQLSSNGNLITEPCAVYQPLDKQAHTLSAYAYLCKRRAQADPHPPQEQHRRFVQHILVQHTRPPDSTSSEPLQ